MELTLTKLTAASVDIGDSGQPGSSASKITCDITARSDGRWEAEGYYSTGCNQGYYQANYGYGPWTGRGNTPEDASDDMIGRADDEYQDDMRRAAHDALLECEGKSFASLAVIEADRIEEVIRTGASNTKVRIAGKSYGTMREQESLALRRRAVKALRCLAGPVDASLASVNDERLMAEAKRRGLIE